jgi:muramoyltetrapeptide carboxypeptidase
MRTARDVGVGSIVDVVAPAGPFDRGALLAGLEVLRAAGLAPRHREDLFDRTGFLAGSDARRAAELREALESPDSSVIWCARGGYGSTRILETVEPERVRRAGKLLVGFSDVTALHGVWQAAGVPSVHGSMVARLAAEPVEVRERLFAIVRGEIAPALAGTGVAPGRARGIVAGGNVALLASLCGTPWQPRLAGTIVLLEEVGERPYRLDRMLVQCRQAGLFRDVAGIAIGELLDCESQGLEIIREFSRGLGVPVVAGLACGHGAVNLAVPFGVPAVLDADAGTLTFLGPATGARSLA